MQIIGRCVQYAEICLKNGGTELTTYMEKSHETSLQKLKRNIMSCRLKPSEKIMILGYSRMEWYISVIMGYARIVVLSGSIKITTSNGQEREINE